MKQRNDSFAGLLVKGPWWISAALAVLSYVGLKWLVPLYFGSSQTGKAVASSISVFAPLAALLFGILALASILFGLKRRRLVDEQASLETLRATPWKDFEIMLAEAYRRQGFTVDYSLGLGADGGVDLALRKDRRTSLVQCKQWRVFAVGVPVVREMFGILTAEKADEAIIITSGRFTREAEEFARGKPITLVDGPQLLELLTSVQSVRTSSSPDVMVNQGEAEPARQVDKPICPQCGNQMILRTAKRGTRVGSQFWGCSDYPRCKATRPA